MEPNVISSEVPFLGDLLAHRYRIMVDYLSENFCENILEIGTHRGNTAIELIKNSKNKDVNYYGVDIFKEGWSREIEYEEQSIEPHSISEVQNYLNQVSKNVFLFSGKSKDKHKDIELKKIKFDLIFIDGGHSYNTVRDDFFMYINQLNEGGVIFFDDYTTEFSYPPDNPIPLGVKPFIDDLIMFGQYNVEIVNEYVDEYRGHLYRIAKVTKKKNLEIITITTPNNTKLLNDFFLPSLPKEITDITIYTVNGLELDKNNWNMGILGDDTIEIMSRFITLMNKKTKFQRDFISNNIGKKIMFIDTDVIFFGDFRDDVLSLLDEYDMVMQDNNLDYNGGVWAMNCNQKVLNYFNELYSEIFMNYKGWILNRKREDNTSEQGIINIILKNYISEGKLKVGKLPHTFYGNHIQGYEFPNNIPQNCKLFHATGTSDLNKKYEMLQTAKEIIK
jgi:predicted O-methyltransferase YrrM